jgi:hypothetical protein
MARLQTLVTDDPGGARKMLRETILGAYLAQPVYNRFLGWMGYEEEAAEIARGWAARDREVVHAAIHDRLVDDLAIVGTAGEVRRRLDEYAAAGVGEAAVSVLVADRAVVEETLRAVAPG